MSSDPKTERRNGDFQDGAALHQQRQPFDTSDLDKLPYPDENDPPYRSFWTEEPRG